MFKVCQAILSHITLLDNQERDNDFLTTSLVLFNLNAAVE